MHFYTRRRDRPGSEIYDYRQADRGSIPDKSVTKFSLCLLLGTEGTFSEMRKRGD
jgi:hypothetical protein